METTDCILCGSNKRTVLFEKKSSTGERFKLNKCGKCGLEYISPRPFVSEMARYYSADYFMQRTDRGYNNYFSPEIRTEIERVIALNLADLGFYQFEKELNGRGKSLDIGCAAGYFVNYLRDRQWVSRGIDVSSHCVAFAREHGLEVVEGDYLDHHFAEQFDLVSMWASIEHLHQPGRFLSKIYNELADNGRLYISTCRSGIWNFKTLFGSKWRYYNFPEHLFFFSFKTIRKLLALNGFVVETCQTYGSGIGSAGSVRKKVADYMAKRIGLGDMMLIGARKIKKT